MEVLVEIVDGAVRVVPKGVRVVVRNYDVKSSDKWIRDEDEFPFCETVWEET